MEEVALDLNVETQSIRGRACPVCGGKIIPSDRAVYQNAPDPEAAISIWQCERCGHEEIFERQRAAKPAKGPAKPEAARLALPPASAPSPARLRRKRGERPPLPPDIREVLEHINRPRGNNN
jgi:hypothetical protein